MIKEISQLENELDALIVDQMIKKRLAEKVKKIKR